MADELDDIIHTHELPDRVATALRTLWQREVRPDAPTELVRAGDTTLRLTEGLPTDPSSSGSSFAAPPGVERYTFLERLGEGGFAAVWRVHDTVMERTVAMKLVHAKLLRDPVSVRRFLAEAHATGRLQHPNIVPVYDVGQLDDGRVWFTMREVQGVTLRTWLATRPPLVRRVAVFLSMCHGLAYAHERGMVHRDVKPSNVMLGSSGEVYVLDWGIAKFLGDALPAGPLSLDGHHTAQGWVGGTPGYMPPEQARGDVTEVDQRADVFALGSVLYEMLEDRHAYGGDAHDALAATLDGPPPPLWDGHPAELRHVVDRAMAYDVAQRFPDASALVAPIQDWLDGAQRRAQAVSLTERAIAKQERVALLRREAAHLRERAHVNRSAVPSWAPEADKYAAWDLEDQADAAELDAELADQDVELGLQAALRVAPDLQEAHVTLIQRTREAHQEAERRRNPTAARKLERQLVRHTEALPIGHPMRIATQAYVAGDGAVTLLTDPPGAEVRLQRLRPHRRRLAESFEGVLGRTPLLAEPVAFGSYVLQVVAPGRASVRIPVHVPRQGHHDAVPPGARASLPIALPPEAHVGDDEVYVPAGWFHAGSTECGASPRRLWADGFVMQRFPVTNAAYLDFLDDLVAQGRTEDALRHAPRERSGAPGELGALLVGFDGRGFQLRPDAQGDVWAADWPVVLVDWHGAMAYAAWKAEADGLPWRLPAEFEWEKASRGVDGRRHPWGELLDPSWTHIAGSRPGRAMPASVESFPADVSVYGVRGLGGNVQDWCLDRFDAPLPVDGQAVVPHVGAVDGDPIRMARGGGWDTTSLPTRCAARSRAAASYRSWQRGFRLVRAFPA